MAMAVFFFNWEIAPLLFAFANGSGCAHAFAIGLAAKALTPADFRNDLLCILKNR